MLWLLFMGVYWRYVWPLKKSTWHLAGFAGLGLIAYFIDKHLIITRM